MARARPAPGPAAVWAATALVGAWTGWWLAGMASRAAGLGLGAAATVLCLGALVGLSRRRPAYHPAAPVGRVAVLVVLVSFAGPAAMHRALLSDGPVDRLASQGGPADMVARVAAEPSVDDERGWWTILRLASLDGTRTRERVVLRGRDTPPVLGATLAFRATARPVDVARGFGQYLQRRHVVAHVSPVGPVEVRAPPGPLVASTEFVRARVRDAAARGLGGDRAGLAVGLITGDTRLLGDDTQDRMAEVGLTHLVAVSGSNVAIVVAGIVLVAGVAGVGARGRRVLVLVGIAWFVVLTRAEPSVLRAAVMAAVVLAAHVRGVGSQPVHALGVAVLVLVAVDPAMAGSLGLLLSAAATGGVLVVAPVVARRLHAWPRPVAALAAATIGAQVAVAPVLLVVDEVPLSSIPANLIAVPAAAVASIVAGVGAVVAVGHPPAASVVFALADPPVRVVLAAARVPDLPVISPADPAAMVAMLGAVVWLLARRGSRVARVALLATAVGAALLVPVARPAPSTLTVTAIDVGQGDAILVEGGGARILVDGGPDEHTVATWLQRRGIRSLDLVVLSHPHADHAAGLPAVVESVDVGAVWLRPVASDQPHEARVRAAAEATRTSVMEPVAGQHAAVGDLDVQVLSPPRGSPFLGSDREVNEMSLVLRVDRGDQRALLTGDAEEEAQDILLERPATLRAGLLKVPHHGSATTDPALFAAVRPRVAMISAGRDNDYGHPHATVLDALRDIGTEVHRTDLAGSVTVEVPPLGSRHDLGAPADRRRRPAVAAGDRTPRERPDLGRRRAVGRHLRRHRAGRVAGTAHPVAVRWPRVRGDPGRAGGPCRPQGRTGGLPRGARRRSRPRARRAGARPDPEDRAAGQEGRRGGQGRHAS